MSMLAELNGFLEPHGTNIGTGTPPSIAEASTFLIATRLSGLGDGPNLILLVVTNAAVSASSTLPLLSKLAGNVLERNSAIMSRYGFPKSGTRMVNPSTFMLPPLHFVGVVVDPVLCSTRYCNCF